MKSRPLKQRIDLPMPAYHKEVTGDDLLTLGDWIYERRDGRWKKTMSVGGFANKTPVNLNRIHGRGGIRFRFSTPIIK